MRKLGFYFGAMTAAFLSMVPLAFAGNIEIETPLSGWRNSMGEQIQYTQRVVYPASSVNTQEDQSTAAVIKGRIASSVKNQDKPFQMIVNGIPMPLRVQNGTFSRPYSFGAGSNNVEIRSPDGEEVSRIQFYEGYTEKNQPKIRVVLSWDTDATDLDLHVITPDGEHAYYGNTVLNNGGALDVDVTTGYGPEIFATPAPIKGTYLVYLNYYGSGRYDDTYVQAREVIEASTTEESTIEGNRSEENLFTEGTTEEEITIARVSVILNENTLDEKVHSVVMPMRHPGDLTLVYSFVYP